jgi:hypothetical protein
MSDQLRDEIDHELALVGQAISMIEREDLSHWSSSHDRVTLDALMEARRALLIEREVGMRQQELTLA